MLSYKRKNREWEGADERNETNEKKPPGKVGGGGVLAGGLAGCGHGRGAGGLSGVAGADAGHPAGAAAEFWQRIGFSAGRILLGFGLGAVSSVVLAVAAGRWAWVEALLAPVMQLVKATPVASFIILALVWVSGSSLSVLISFLMVLPVRYGAVRTGIGSVDVQLLEMAKVFRLPLGRRLRAIWLPAVLPAFRQGCSVALGICWKSGVAAEVIGLPDGSIGDALYRAKITLSTGELFAWTFVIILLSAVFEKLFLALLDRAVARVLGEEGV